MDYRRVFERTVRNHGSDTAVVTDDGREFTYREFDRRTTRLANVLQERLGSVPCAVLALNGPPAVESMLAGIKRGVETVQLPFRGRAGELVTMAETAGARGLVFDDANADTAVEMLDRGEFDVGLHAGEATVERDDVVSYEAALADAADDLADELPVADDCAVFYTSGTTSVPKAISFDQRQMWLGAMQVVMEHGIDETDVALVTTPWYHMVTSDAWLYPHFLAGATVVLHSSFDPTEALELIEDHAVTGLLAVPTQLTALNDVQAEAGYDVDSLTYIRTGGAIVTPELVERTKRLLTEGVYNTYGMTEAGPDLAFAHPSAQDDHPGTIGKESFSWEIRVVEAAPITEHPDPTATVDPGERGEIIARGPGMAEGYIDNDEAERKSFFDGWLRTRDVARVDEDGYLYVVDRVDNMFTSGGENVYPAEVERALEDHDTVEEACVVGVADDHWGNVVSAVVVCDGSATADDFEEFCLANDSLADFKRPREYAITDEPLPRTDTGTIKRERIRSEHFE
ncbi:MULTISPECIES: class I adenylate-forming enzyme family protein [Halorussus]|uniref:class I adenylate-forming enzyme family protein n=1 Tax=Halorussus TaxID=1070314 RepID=UPI00209DB433|nr:AMP-binding protein [Halorussus vallis]USZ78233.1 AMP-binding protein [Halorussus vallis]